MVQIIPTENYAQEFACLRQHLLQEVGEVPFNS